MKKQLHKTTALLLLLLLGTTAALHAQWQNGLWTEKQAYNWYFYNQAGLSFETSPPTPLLNGNISGSLAQEGSGTISDTEGNLLFYTDGRTVWNANHEIMQNGENLLGFESSTQQGLIVPIPGNENIYYLFTLEDQGNQNRLRYSEIDMSLDNGLGSVTENKNIFLYEFTSEKMTAVHHSDGNSVWVIIHTGFFGNQSEYLSFLITEDGIDTNPVISAVGDPFEGFGQGQMKASPDGKKLAMIDGAMGLFALNLQIADFDNSTGEVSNAVSFPSLITSNGYAVEFSSNSQYLYFLDHGFGIGFSKIFQLDLLAGDATDILNSAFLISQLEDQNNSEEFSSFQLGPDGKIYISMFGYGDIGIINFPNNYGLDVGFEPYSVSLGGATSGRGLPGFIQSYFASGILYEGDDCPGEEINFSTLRIPGIESIVWNFGDGNTGTGITTTHNYTEGGTYTVTAEITSNGAIQHAATEVIILDAPDTAIPSLEDLTLCDEGNGEVVFDLTLFNGTILGGQDPVDFTVDYFLTEIDAINNDDAIDPADAFVTNGQTIYVRVTNNDTGCYTILPIELVVLPFVEATTPPDLSQCDDGSGEALFDLTVQNAPILDGQNPDDFEITYHTDATDADAGINEIDPADAFVSAGQTIYARLTDTDTGCYDVVPFELEVLLLPVAGTPSDLEVCDAGNGEATFDLTLQDNPILDGQNPGDFTVTYHIELADADTGINAIGSPDAFVSSGQTIYARLTHNTGGCYDVVSFGLIVLPLPDANPVGDLILCDTGSGTAFFDLSLQDAGILGSQNPGGFNVTYHTSLADAENGTNVIGNPESFESSGQTIYARVTDTDTTCHGITQFDLIVQPLPLAVNLPDLEACDSGTLEGTAVFDLTVQETILLQNQTDVAIAYFLSQGDTDANTNAIANPEAYTNTSNPQDIFVRVNNPDFDSCYTTTSFSLEVFAADLVFGSLELIGCSPFDLTRIFDELDAGLGVEFYTTQEDALAQSNAIPNPENFIATGQAQTLYIRVTDAEGCADIAELRLTTGDCAIPEGISPNNDGRNDSFDLSFLTATYGSESMEIYNRNGTIVFEEANYSDQWAGQDKNGNDLPTGTYFYVLKLREAHPEFGQVISRWVYLQR